MKKKNRNTEIFSLSALDLFASAMGAFVLLSVMMLPYYFKGKEFEKEIGQLEKSLARTQAVSDEAKRAEQKKHAELASVKTAAIVTVSRESKMLAEERVRTKRLSASLKELGAKIRSTEKQLASTPIIKKPKKTKVTFRFLGLKTTQETFLVLVDGSRRIKQRAPNLPKILREVVSVMGPGKKFAIAFYRSVNRKFEYIRWPNKGFAEGGRNSQSKATNFMRREYASMRGTSPTSKALKRALQDTPDAVILLSDGFIFGPHNEGKSGDQVAAETGIFNRANIEIHTVAIGIFYSNPNFYGFLRHLSQANNGDFKAVPP